MIKRCLPFHLYIPCRKQQSNLHLSLNDITFHFSESFLHRSKNKPWLNKVLLLSPMQKGGITNHHRLMELLGHIPSVEAEANFYSQSVGQTSRGNSELPTQLHCTTVNVNDSSGRPRRVLRSQKQNERNDILSCP